MYAGHTFDTCWSFTLSCGKWLPIECQFCQSNISHRLECLWAEICGHVIISVTMIRKSIMHPPPHACITCYKKSKIWYLNTLTVCCFSLFQELLSLRRWFGEMSHLRDDAMCSCGSGQDGVADGSPWTARDEGDRRGIAGGDGVGSKNWDT